MAKQLLKLLITLILINSWIPQDVNAQTCKVTDYIYLNDPQDYNTNGFVHKLKIGTGGVLAEVANGNGTTPWFPAGGGLGSPHGLGQDLNGNLYIGANQISGPIAKIKCDGTLVDLNFINDAGYNIISKDGYLYVNSNNNNRISRYALCDGSLQGYVTLNGVPDNSTNNAQIDWGLSIDKNGTMYATLGFLESDANGLKAIYRFKPTDADFINHTNYNPLVSANAVPPGVAQANLPIPSAWLWGITSDNVGNMYVIAEDPWFNYTSTDFVGKTWILKYDINGNLVASVSQRQDQTPIGGFKGGRGIVYYETLDVLYVAAGPYGDCIAMIRPSDLAYLGAAAANIPGQNPKTLRIASEACPVYTSTKVDTTLCNVKVGDKLFLSQIVGACNAPICGGTWTAAQTNVGMTFNQCDLSFTVTGLNGCGKYILSNTGGACGDFTIEVNIDFASVTAPEIAGDQTVCSSTTPTAFSIVTPATGSGAITYQWQKSTVSCSAGFTNITGATSSTYQPSEVSQTTYYRVIASVQGGCSFPLKQCSDTSNCATIKVASALATATPGSCNTATNQYSISGIISLTNAIAGVATITDGTVSTSITIAASATSVAYSMTGLVSDGTSHPVTVSLAGCGSATATYTAPASCTVAPCGLVMTLTPGICASATNTYVLSGSVTATNLPTSGTITITSGAFADRLIPVPAGNASGPISYSGLISNGQAYTVTASFSNTACTPVNQTYTAPASCSVTPVCAMSAAASAGLCASATNAYSASVAITLSNAPAGTITVSLPGSTPIVQVLAANTSSFTAVFAGLVSDGASHTATISLPGCGSTTATFTAPVACSVAPVCSMSAVVTAGICQTATNTFSSTAVVTLSNPTVGILTITNGPASQTFATTAVTTATFTAVFDGITSDGSSRTLTAALSGCGTLTQTYTAPSSCSAIPVCSLSARATAGVCNTATNTYSSTAVVVLTNPTTGTLTIIDGPQSATFATTAGSSATFTVGFTDLVSDGSLHTVQATLSGCSSTTTTYTAPSSCSVAPVCSLSVTVSVGTCATATNTYSATATVTALNPPAGASLSVVTAGRTLVFSTTAISQNTFVATFNGLTSDGVNRPVVVSLPGCGTTSASYTAPASCSVVPVCSVSAVVSTGQCSTATNTFSNTVTVTMTNPSAGTLTVSDGVRSVTVIVPATIGTVTAPAVFNGLVSDGSLHTLTVSLPGCASLATTFSAPVSCTTCSLSITTASLPNGQVGTAYSQTLTASGGTAPLSYSVSVGSLPAGLSLNGTTGVISGTPTSATNASFTILLTDGKACSDAQPLTITTSALPVCSLTATATAGVCNTATNTYTVTGSVSATNATANQSLTISVGSVYTTVALTGNGPVSYTLVGLVSDGLAHTVSVLSSATACGTANVTYTAPLSCSIASAGLGDYVFLDANKDGIQNTGDTPISGVTVILYTNGVASATTVTNASGFYSFTGLTAGISQSYVVGFTPPTGYTTTAPLSGTDKAKDSDADLITGKTQSVTLAAGEFNPTLDAGFYLPAPTLSLDKFVDKSKAKIGDVLTYTLVLTNSGTGSATNVVVHDSSSIGLTYVANSATAPAGTTFTAGVPSSSWSIATISGGQSLSLTFQARADSSGILYNKATIPGDTATVCTSIPIIMCAGDVYTFRLTVAPGRSSYKWYKDNVELIGQTTNVLDVSAPGTYSLAVDNVSGKCPDFSCCPFIIEEDTLPTFRAVAVPVTCVGNVAQANGKIVLSGFNASYTYQYSLGTSFNATASLSGAKQVIPTGGAIVTNLANPVAAQFYTIRVYNASGCYTDVTVQLLPTVCGCPTQVCVPLLIRQTKRAVRLGALR